MCSVLTSLHTHRQPSSSPLCHALPPGPPTLCPPTLPTLRLLESVNPESEDLAVTNYKLATFYYVNDMLQDANVSIRKAAQGLRAVFPEDHDLVGWVWGFQSLGL